MGMALLCGLLQPDTLLLPPPLELLHPGSMQAPEAQYFPAAVAGRAVTGASGIRLLQLTGALGVLLRQRASSCLLSASSRATSCWASANASLQLLSSCRSWQCCNSRKTTHMQLHVHSQRVSHQHQPAQGQMHKSSTVLRHVMRACGIAWHALPTPGAHNDNLLDCHSPLGACLPQHMPLALCAAAAEASAASGLLAGPPTRPAALLAPEAAHGTAANMDAGDTLTVRWRVLAAAASQHSITHKQCVNTPVPAPGALLPAGRCSWRVLRALCSPQHAPTLLLSWPLPALLP